MAASPEEPLTFPRPVPDDFRITHPEDYAAHGYPHQIWERLRREEPVSWQVQPGNAIDYWAITKHADIMEIGKKPAIFVSGPRLVIQHLEEEVRDLPPTLIQMDNPMHRDFRGMVSKQFTPRALKKITEPIEKIGKDLVDQLYDRGDEGDVHEICAERGLGYTPFSPLAGGLLTGKYRAGEAYPEGSRLALRPEPYLEHLSERGFAALERLREAAGDYGVSMAGLALAWVLRHPGVTAPVIGPRREEHFEPVREALSLSLGPERHAELAALFG